MALTETDKELAQIFAKMDLDLQDVLGIVSLLRKDSAEKEFLEFLKANPDTSRDDLIKKVFYRYTSKKGRSIET